MVKNIHIFQSHAFQALVKARQKIFTAAPVSVRALPHIIAGLGCDDQFITIRHQFFFQDLAEIPLCTSVGRSVIIGKVKLCDAIVKSCKTQLFHIFIIRSISEIMP